MSTCHQTGKRIFSEDEAYRILDEIQYGNKKRKRFSRRHEKRVYGPCEHCGHWHLTSQK